MSKRKVPLVTGEYYHVFNRGVAKNTTFFTPSDYRQALLGLEYYSFEKPRLKLSDFKKLSVGRREEFLASLTVENEPLVEVVCFTLMPNHFHFLLKQVRDNGISLFISKFTNSYTKYINTKHKRVGPLFQGIFKAVYIETTEQLLHVSRYIHLNPLVAGLVTEERLQTYPWPSLSYYVNDRNSFTGKDVVLSNFETGEAYKNFVLDQAEYGRVLEEIKHVIIDDD